MKEASYKHLQIDLKINEDSYDYGYDGRRLQQSKHGNLEKNGRFYAIMSKCLQG